MGSSHDGDGGGDERGGEEASSAIGVFPLPLVHLSAAILAATTNTEAHGQHGDQDHEQNADGGAHQEPQLIVGPLSSGRRYNTCQSPLSINPVDYTEAERCQGAYLEQEDDIVWLHQVYDKETSERNCNNQSLKL